MFRAEECVVSCCVVALTKRVLAEWVASCGMECCMLQLSYRIAGEEGISFAKKTPSVGCGRDGPFRSWALLRARSPGSSIPDKERRHGSQVDGSWDSNPSEPWPREWEPGFLFPRILQMHPPLGLHHPWPSMQLACPGLFAFDHSCPQENKYSIVFSLCIPCSPPKVWTTPCHPNHFCYRFRQPFQGCPPIRQGGHAEESAVHLHIRDAPGTRVTVTGNPWASFALRRRFERELKPCLSM